jgi:hypothetical protein
MAAMKPDLELDLDPGRDPFLVWAVRVVGVLLAVASLVFGIYLFEGGGFDALYPQWGWLLDGVLGGAFMGFGAGLGVTSVTGENRLLNKLRARREIQKALTGNGGPQMVGSGEPPEGATEKSG